MVMTNNQDPANQGRVCGDNGRPESSQRRQIDEQSCSSTDSGQPLEGAHEEHTYNDPTHFMLKDVIV